MSVEKSPAPYSRLFKVQLDLQAQRQGRPSLKNILTRASAMMPLLFVAACNTTASNDHGVDLTAEYRGGQRVPARHCVLVRTRLPRAQDSQRRALQFLRHDGGP